MEEIIAYQMPIIEAKVDKLKEKHTKIVDHSREVDDEKESFEVAKVSGDISQARIRNYGKSCVKQRS